MPRVCTICRHPQKVEINQAIVSGEPRRSIATRFRISDSVVQRHKAHLPKTLVVDHEAQQLDHATDLLANVTLLREQSFEILASARAVGDNREALLAIREARNCLELEAKVKGELADDQISEDQIRPRIELTPAQLEAGRKFAHALLRGKVPQVVDIEAHAVSEETHGA